MVSHDISRYIVISYSISCDITKMRYIETLYPYPEILRTDIVISYPAEIFHNVCVCVCVSPFFVWRCVVYSQPSSTSRTNQQHPLRHIGRSGANNASTASSANNTPSLCRAWSVVTCPFETSYRHLMDSSPYSPYTIRLLNDPWPIKTNLRPTHFTSSWNANYGSACLQCHKTGRLARGVWPHPDTSPLAPTAALD